MIQISLSLSVKMHYLKQNLKLLVALVLLDRDPDVGLRLEPPLNPSPGRLHHRVSSTVSERNLCCRTQSGSAYKSACKNNEQKKKLTAVCFSSDSSVLLQTQAQNTFNTQGVRDRLIASSEEMTEISPICSLSDLTQLTPGDSEIAAGVSSIH